MLIIHLDMDGDGRADYCTVSPTLHCWRNGGVGDAPAYWQEMSGFNTYILGPQADTEPIVTKDFVTGIMLRNSYYVRSCIPQADLSSLDRRSQWRVGSWNQ